MGHMREKMKADLELKGFAIATQKEYLLRVRHFAAHFRRSPDQLGEREVREFLLHLLNKKQVKPATHRMYVAALKFLYVTTLRRPQEVANIPWPKVPRSLPDVLSGEEIRALLQAVKSIKHRAILMVAYGGGLRIQEACSLRTTDIDSKRMLIHIHQGKRGKDRFVMLSDRLLIFLRRLHIRPSRHRLPTQIETERRGTYQ